MLLTESILTGSTKQAVAVVSAVLGNHTLAATRISGDRKAGQLCILANQALVHKRLNKCHKSACMATGVGNAFGRGDFVLAAKLGEAVGPALFGAVSGRGVNDNRVGVVNHTNCLNSSSIGQAQKSNIGAVQRVASCGIVLAKLLRQADNFNILSALKTLCNAKARSACAAVDKYLCHSLKPHLKK